MMTCEGWWGDYGPAQKKDGPVPQGQKQQAATAEKPRKASRFKLAAGKTAESPATPPSRKTLKL